MKVKTGLWDGDSFGNEWQIHFEATESEENPGTFDIWKTDGNGNGDHFATVTRRADALDILTAFRRAYPE